MIAKENKHTINHSEKCIFLPKKGNNLRKREEKQNEKTKKKKNLKSQAKGITLIALVITIIVLLILAGVTIATLTGENGILTKATESKEETEIEGAKENARLDISNWIAEKLENGEDANLSDEIIKGILTRKEYVKTAGDISFISKEGEHEILYSELYTPQNQEDKEEVPIPDGFYHVEDTTIEGGYVVSDVEGDDLANTKGGNQYVWIPVDGSLGEDGDISDVTGNEKKILLGRYTFSDKTGVPKEYTGSNYLEETQEEHTASGYENSVAQDIDDFINSVRQKGGYYIARFEASKGENEQVESKYDKSVWRGQKQPKASELCQNLYTTIKSDLINSYAWDTAIIYIQKYSGDSRYSKQNSLQDSLANTGKATDGTNFDIKCNIYDMAGNCMEWTTETYTGSTPCVTRGNHYYQPEHGYPPLYTGERYHFGLGDSVTEDVDRLRASFRPILYF